ncbi:hypothetical protein HMN09_01165300 [Mycena chlorophos]|uniref:Uncharacterized protein n=1 Tax=Mycena chlorophos TaxID=658473 RepID=A0A8H6S8W6_MYCCL|nr:hypothetical protein HMN09_01165300 [Mycena chlorophos]
MAKTKSSSQPTLKQTSLQFNASKRTASTNTPANKKAASAVSTTDVEEIEISSSESDSDEVEIVEADTSVSLLGKRKKPSSPVAETPAKKREAAEDRGECGRRRAVGYQSQPKTLEGACAESQRETGEASTDSCRRPERIRRYPTRFRPVLRVWRTRSLGTCKDPWTRVFWPQLHVFLTENGPSKALCMRTQFSLDGSSEGCFSLSMSSILYRSNCSSVSFATVCTAPATTISQSTPINYPSRTKLKRRRAQLLKSRVHLRALISMGAQRALRQLRPQSQMANTNTTTDIFGLFKALTDEVQGLRSEFQAQVQGLQSEFQAQVQGLRSEVQGLCEEVKELRDEVKGLTKRVAHIEGRLSISPSTSSTNSSGMEIAVEGTVAVLVEPPASTLPPSDRDSIILDALAISTHMPGALDD